MPTLRERLEADLKGALRDRDRARVSVLRTTLAALSNAEAVDPTGAAPRRGVFATEVDRRELTPEDVVAILKGERDALRSAVEEYVAGGQAAAADELRAKAAILDAYLAEADGGA